MFFFDYGVVAIWGLSKSQETLLVKTLANPCAVHPLPATEIEARAPPFQPSLRCVYFCQCMPVECCLVPPDQP